MNKYTHIHINSVCYEDLGFSSNTRMDSFSWEASSVSLTLGFLAWPIFRSAESPSSEILGGTLPGSDEDEEEKQVPEGSPETSAAGWRGCFLGPEDRFSERWWLKNLLLLWSWLSHDHHRSTQTSYYSHPWDDESTSQICCRVLSKETLSCEIQHLLGSNPKPFFHCRNPSSASSHPKFLRGLAEMSSPWNPCFHKNMLPSGNSTYIAMENGWTWNHLFTC